MVNFCRKCHRTVAVNDYDEYFIGTSNRHLEIDPDDWTLWQNNKLTLAEDTHDTMYFYTDRSLHVTDDPANPEISMGAAWYNCETGVKMKHKVTGCDSSTNPET